MAKKVVNFNDFNREIEKSDLQDTSGGFSKNTNDGQQVVGNQKMVYNKVTRKWDNVTKDMIDDKIEEIDKVDEAVFPNTEKAEKVKFEITYEGSNPPSKRQIEDALSDAEIDSEGKVKVKKLN